MSCSPLRTARVRLRGLHEAVRGRRAPSTSIDLDVREGEVLALLGPSGCGKTTTLRLVAGFERPDAGRIVLGGRRGRRAGRFVPPERRRVGVVFQDYALFPHLTVAQNVGYGIRDRDARGAAGSPRCWTSSGLAGETPPVPARALGRPAAAGRARRGRSRPSPRWCCSTSRSRTSTPRCASACAARSARSSREAGATAVFVTHDQEEALSLADRVAVMRDGRRPPGRRARRPLRASRPTASLRRSSATPTCCPGRAEDGDRRDARSAGSGVGGRRGRR